MEDQELHLEADKSLGRVSARAVLSSLRTGQQPAANPLTLPPPFPSENSSQHSSPNSYRTAPNSPPKADIQGKLDSSRVLPNPPPQRKLTEERVCDQTLSRDNSEPLRGDRTPDTLFDTHFKPVALKININERQSLPQADSHRIIERTNAHPSDRRTEILNKPDIKLVLPSPTVENPDDQKTGFTRKPEDKIPLTKLTSSLRSSNKSKSSVKEKLKEKLSGCDKEKQNEGAAGDHQPEKEPTKQKPNSRLSVEHQLLGVSTSTISNCTDQNSESDCITVNEAIQKSGLGRYHVLPFLAAAMVIILKCFLDGVPDNFVAMFHCVFSMTKNDSQRLVVLGFFGSILGAPIGGVLADRFGRRMVVGVGLVSLVVITAVFTGATHSAVLTTFYVLFSMFISAIHPIMLVYVMELSPTKSRYITLTMCFVCYSLFSFIVPLTTIPVYKQSSNNSFDSNNWRIPWGVVLAPILICIGILYFSPDSPRFNAAKGQTKRAQFTVFKMLDTNLGDKLRLSLSTLELSSNSDPIIPGLSLTKLFLRPIQGTTILLTAFLFVCNVQYFASHVLTEEMLTNRCSCGVDMTSKGVPWSDNYYCDGLVLECNPQDVHGRTCCHEGTCQSVQYLNRTFNVSVCSDGMNAKCESVHTSIESRSQGSECTSRNTSKYYIFNAVRNVLYVIGFGIGILLAQYTSRKDAFIHLAFYITFINGLLFAVCKFLNGITFLVFVTSLGFNTVIGAVYSLSWLYMVEYYPTSLRCTGVGYLAGMGQLGNGLGTLLSKYTLQYDLNVYGRLTIHLFLSNLLTVLSFMLELETKRLPMSDRKRVDCLDHKLSAKSDELPK